MSRPAWITEALAKLEYVTKGPWVWQEANHTGYPQRIVANDDGLVLICDVHEGPQGLADNGNHIARYDPDTVRRLLELLGEAHDKLRNYEGWLRAGGAIDSSLAELITQIESGLNPEAV